MTNEGGPAARSNRLQLVLVLVVFLGPVLLAGLLYVNADRWLGTGPTGQHGELYQPARPLDGLPVTGADGGAMSLDDLRGKWTLVVIGSGQCGSDCRDALYKVRQAHKAQGKNIGRVQRLFVALDGRFGPHTRDFLAAEHPHLKLGIPDGGKQALAQFRHPEAAGLRGIYLVDPNVNLVMRYGWDVDAEGILKDLEHLLKHSAIG
ncbi:MAG TPA: SCO family protein [Gammaproteobacteria bacterium]|nr:SCO family protein [Gammaproteobacteria bacterium]